MDAKLEPNSTFKVAARRLERPNQRLAPTSNHTGRLALHA